MMVITGHPEANGAGRQFENDLFSHCGGFLCEKIYISNTSRSRFHSKHSL